ncbi:hypothetical protein [Halobacterium zhouii]|uniref:hypothetical protein n=1 Tax=Halobacterium zhouii TaxID=2902624 RepID=UPI001E43D850|nr:hypothetical protein [Halobacterium zhouii]
MVAVAGVVLGLVLVAVGAGVVRYAYSLTKVEEQIDAIGSKRSGDVEPAGWHVTLTKLFGGVVAAGGLVVLALALQP